MADPKPSEWKPPGDHPCHKTEDCEGTMKYEGDEYNGLSGGGDYIVYRCHACHARCYVQMPD